MAVKEFKTYEEQVEILLSRGMTIEDPEEAVEYLSRVSYYRLSGYWYPFKRKTNDGREDQFFPETNFSDVVSLYEFDERLRTAAFNALAPVELNLRALLGHELGYIDECAHLKPELLSARAQGPSYSTWIEKFNSRFDRSEEDFVAHHKEKYGGILPVWAAVELLELGSLRYLFGFAPRPLQNKVSGSFGLSAPQLESWMKAMEILRNACAHHGRLFNRVYTKTPKLPTVDKFPELDMAGPYMNRTFGQLTLVQHLRDMQGIGMSRMLSAVLDSYPSVKFVPKSHLGIPDNWELSSLWAR